eukprot:COSAG06_NODE_16019_length_1028_cov_1.245425_1_plen_148_part_01
MSKMLRLSSHPGVTVSTDDTSKRSRLRESRRVKAALRRFWDLMVIESQRTSGTNEDAVTREGYTMMHVRVAKALSADFDYGEAQGVAGGDWANDIINFSGDTAEMIWLEEVKKKFREAANSWGWNGLFDAMDQDGNGELDREEFGEAV